MRATQEQMREMEAARALKERAEKAEAALRAIVERDMAPANELRRIAHTALRGRDLRSEVSDG